jgi:hypothetical protein
MSAKVVPSVETCQTFLVIVGEELVVVVQVPIAGVQVCPTNALVESANEGKTVAVGPFGYVIDM